MMSDAPSKPHVRMRKGDAAGGDGGEPVAPAAGRGVSPINQPPAPPPPPSIRSRCRRLCVNILLAMPIVLGLVMYNFKTIHDELQAWRGYGLAYMYEGISDEVLHQFRVYDVDGNGYIDPYEFDQLTRSKNFDLQNLQESFVDDFVFNDIELGPGKEVITVKTVFEPLVLETMVKFQEQKEFLMGDPRQLLPGLYHWKEPHIPAMSYGARNFRAFLPPHPNTAIGHFYEIVDVISVNAHIAHLHMNRYSPPVPEKREELLFSLLSHFHPNVFLQNRFGPRGSMALVRARNSQFLDIMMRIHAEYELNKLPHYPFWFTPGQFSARVIMDREANHVEYFELYVPTDRKLNIDMEWVTGPGSNEVDIGYVPEMRLVSVKPSSEYVPNATVDLGEGEPKFDPSAIQWDEEISIERAKSLLEQSLYPFKRIPYLRFTDAIDLARETNRLVHFILLWGALDDQSC